MEFNVLQSIGVTENPSSVPSKRFRVYDGQGNSCSVRISANTPALALGAIFAGRFNGKTVIAVEVGDDIVALDCLYDAVEDDKEYKAVFAETNQSAQPTKKQFEAQTSGMPICEKLTNNPLEIYTNPGEKLTLHGLQQFHINLKEEQKNRQLVDLLDALEFTQVVIFVKSVDRCEVLNNLLVVCHFPSTLVHSLMKQEERIARYKDFYDFKSRIMISTDLFDRGVYFECADVVINYDMADDKDSYLHRVGRSGCFGSKGLAISFISSEEDAMVLNDVQAKFDVNIPTMPDKIDPSTYIADRFKLM